MSNNIMIQYYQELYTQFGNSPKSLGWHKGKQFLRFHQLTSDWDLNNSSILDVGCGFGDFIKYLSFLSANDYQYTGVDIVDEFIVEAKKYFNQENIDFIKADFLPLEMQKSFDYVIASGTFNFKIEGINGYDYIYQNMKKMFAMSNKAISIDFITDKVDIVHPHNFNSSPEKILEMAYSLSRNVILKNNYFPFEFSITIYKNDSFRKETTIFSDIEKKLEWIGI